MRNHDAGLARKQGVSLSRARGICVRPSHQLETNAYRNGQSSAGRYALPPLRLFVVSQFSGGADADRTADLARVAAYPQGPTRKLKADENDILNEAQEIRNERALAVFNRVQHKLTGEPFSVSSSLTNVHQERPVCFYRT